MAGFRFFIFASIKYHSVVHFQRVQERKFVRLKFNVLKLVQGKTLLYFRFFKELHQLNQRVHFLYRKKYFSGDYKYPFYKFIH